MPVSSSNPSSAPATGRHAKVPTMYSHAPFSWLCNFDGLSLRQLVKSYHYAAQWLGEKDTYTIQCAQLRIEICRRIA